MPPSVVAAGKSRNYATQLFELLRVSVVQLGRAPTQVRRRVAARRLGRNVLLFTTVGGAFVIALMTSFDATEIALMPPRGSPDLWPARILTDFGKNAFVLYALIAALAAIALAAPLLQRAARAKLLRLGTQVQYLFFSVAFSNLLAEALKYAAGRGRPFVGGKANVVNFVPFAGTEAYFSFPSAHAVTAFALAFAVGSIWPRARIAIWAYALLIGATRLVLLAHHPSDVAAGAIVGILGAMVVRYWFAARRLGFAVRAGGEIVPL